MIAIVPMKHNSERVKDKNFKSLCGKPLFSYVLDSLLASAKIKKVVVNTDSDVISEGVAKLFGNKIEISVRPKEICGDFVSMNRVIEFEIKRNGAGEYLQTHTTNPFLKTATIDGAIEKFRSSLGEGYDSLFSVNVIKSRLYDESFRPINHDPANLIRTQDLPPVYDENSNLYIFSDKSFAKKQARIGTKPFLFPMDKVEAIDIDNQDDWDLAESRMQNLRKPGQGQ
ncbi:MAG: acylneuraminate cytidylyltransferase family protein [Bdellovibrionota bacterium]